MMKLPYVSIAFFVTSITPLAIAYIFEYIFGYMPCKLCIYERIPYIIILLFSIIYYFKPYRWMFYLMSCAYMLNILISCYHSGLEHTWFSDILGCTESVSMMDTFDDIKNNLLNEKNFISCSKREFVFFGLSLAEWNILYCFFSLIIIYKLNNK